MRGVQAIAKSPTVQCAKHEDEDVDADEVEQELERPLGRNRLVELIAHFEEHFRVVGAHGVELVADTPVHCLLLIDRPGVDLAIHCFRIADEFSSPGSRVGGLQHVEGHVWQGKELSCIWSSKADVCDGERRKILVTKGNELGCPAAQHDALLPGCAGWARHTIDDLGHASHNVIGVVVHLEIRLAKFFLIHLASKEGGLAHFNVEQEPYASIFRLGEKLDEFEK